MIPILLLAFADNPGIAEMQQARQDLSSSFFSAFDCSLVLAVIIGIIGAVRIHHNWQIGERDYNAVAGWFFAALFMVLSGAFLKAVFGI